MNRLTAVFLILLRLAIGWHFLYEGLHKLHSIELGETSTNPRPFTSASYFRDAPGPFATFMRGQLGDPDAVAVAELTVEPVPAGEDVTRYPPRKRMPALLKQEWEDYVARFSAYYGLDDEQRKRAQAILEQAESKIVTWLTNPADDKTPTVKKTYPSGVVEEKLSIPQRILEYKAALEDLHNATVKRLRAFNHDVEGKRLLLAKADVTRLRTGLLDDLKAKTAEYLETPLQKNLELTAEQLEKGALPEPEVRTKQWWVDRITVWFLIVVGGCLMVGLFSRLNCLAAAAFLCMTYLAAPPFPWLPVPPVSEGNYAWVNKNLIEMLALLALATTASGRWLGVDALIHAVVVGVRGRRPEPRRV